MRTKKITLKYFGILLLAAAAVQAQVPHVINYQGILNDPTTGAPIDTTQTMIFSIYGASNSVVAIWQETQNNVLIQNGYFSAMLGSVTPISPGVFEGDEKYLGVKVGDDPEMTPRKRIFSVGYAFKAENTDKVAGQTLSSNDGSVNESGDPVSWYKIKDMPAGFADGADAVGLGGISQVDVGTGLSVTNPTGPTTTLGLKMGHGNGINADMVDGKHASNFAASSHDHLGEHWSGSLAWAAAILKVTNLSSGPGIYGINKGGGNGVRGQTTGTGIGVYGQCDNSGPGVAGRSTSGDGVQGFGQDSGVYGEATGSAGQGVFGKGIGANAEGVVGQGGSNAAGVWGMSTNQEGVRGISTEDAGVQGSSTNQMGVFGTSTNGNGVEGQTNASSRAGVFGQSSNGRGVVGQSTNKNGVEGSTSGGSSAFGVKGTSSGVNSTGVLGEANNGSSAYGIWGKSTSGYAGYFTGNVQVAGDFSVLGNKSFKIDHPLDPANKYLYHYCIESKERANLYSGNATFDANGEAVVQLPEWFEALNKDFRYQLTCIGGFAQVYIAEEIQNNRFKIAGGVSGMRISWQVTGIRNDAYAQAHPAKVTVMKPAAERGTYLSPKEHGMPEILSMESVKSGNVEVK